MAKGRDVDNMQKGIRALANGGLKKWIGKTTRARGLIEDISNSALESGLNHGDGNSTKIDNDMWLGRDRDEDTSFDGHMTFGVMHAKDGELVVEYEGKEDNIEDKVDGTAEINL